MTPLHLAQTYLGTKEDTGHNDGAMIREFLGLGGAPANEELAWCAAFVLYCLGKCKIAIPGNKWAMRNAAEFYRVMRDNGCLIREPKEGAIVFFHSRGESDVGPGGHVGLVESVSSLDITTIEGNVGNAVTRCNHLRSLPRIRGYAFLPKGTAQ